jgi:hypothetical protein
MGNDGNSINVRISYKNNVKEIKCYKNITIEELITQYIKNYLNPGYSLKNFTLKIDGKKCLLNKTIETYKNYIINNSTFYLTYDNDNDNLTNAENEPSDGEDISDDNSDDFDINEKDISLESCRAFNMEINMKFFKIDKNHFDKNYDSDLHGLLKLCLLKEIAKSDDFYSVDGLPKVLGNIMSILKKGKINYDNIEAGIKAVLTKINGANIMCFSKYVDELISQNDINKYLIPKLHNSRDEIQYIRNCLGKYVEHAERFEQELERAKKNSVFEYSIISSAIIEREDIDKFESNRLQCQNRVDRVLFHGTSYWAIGKILPTLFKSSRCIQHGNGVYFTEDLESCWIYGSEAKSNNATDRRNKNIPKIGEYFSFIASAIYYDEKGFRRVYDWKYTPKKNEVNFAWAGVNQLETIKGEPDRTHLIGTEYVINDPNQICPFMSFKLQRDEYCIIWRDNNFSPKPVYNNKFDAIFKQFLKERMEYINKMAKYNVYPCETSEEALNLIRRKKYNKIILISNIGTDYGGKKFIEEARKIIGNEVVVLFNAYSINHLNWVKNYKNAFFSNQPEFYEQYLECFYDKNEDECKEAIKKLKKDIEKHYKVQFNFDDTFLDYPYTKNEKIKLLSDLVF